MRFITDVIKKDEEAIEQAIKRRQELIDQIRETRENHTKQEAKMNTDHVHQVSLRQQKMTDYNEQLDDIRTWVSNEPETIKLKEGLKD
jgi:UTP-glucose-1-phosphate uridylyltransferase